MSRYRTLVLVVASLVVAVALLASSQAFADSIQLRLSKEAVQEETTQITYTASSEAVGFVSVTVNNAGTPCGSLPEDDSGTPLVEAVHEPRGQTGTYSGSVDFTPSSTGSYIVCGWVTGYAVGETPVHGPELAVGSLPVEVRPPHISLSLGVPHRLAAHKSFTLELTASSEVKRSLIVLAVPDTGSCPVSAAATSAKNLVEAEVDGGPRAFTAKIGPLSGASKWMFCAYADPPGDGAEHPQATTSAVVILVTHKPHHRHHRKHHKHR